MSETPRTDEQHALFPMGGFTLDFARQLDTLVKALSMYGLPYSDEDLEYMAQNPSPHTHEAKRELIRRKALAAVKENHE